MKTLFKLIPALLLITVQVVQAQKPSSFEMDEIHTIYDESFSTDSNTTIVLNLSNSAVQIYKSKDDKVHIKYTMEFNNYRKKIVESRLKSAIVSGKKENNKITYTSKSRNSRYYREYQFEEILFGRLGKNKDTTQTAKPVIRKSLDSVLCQINLSERTRRNNLYGTLKIKPRVKKWKKSVKIQITKMIIYIPENIHVRFTLENSNLVFFDDLPNQVTMNSMNSKLKFKKVGNPLNNFDIDNGYFNAEEIAGGSYNFANTKELTIGRISNSLLNSEFTKIEIGEIGSNNEIVDFNSKFYLYNFSNDFEALNINSEYSEINLFLPKDMSYQLTTFGNYTKHFVDNELVGFPIDKNKTYTKMLDLSQKGNDNNLNAIKINTINGIIRIAKDVIELGQ